MKKSIIIILLTYISIYFISCQDTSTQNSSEQLTSTVDTTILKTDKSHEKKVKKIFYTIPSPIEMNNLLKKAGVPFESSVLNPLSNYDKYITIQKLALNLGIYGADVSYARIMDQIQVSLNYIIVIKKISDKLGIPEQETKDIFERLEKNINIKDSVLNLISQTYGYADAYFKNNDQGSIAALIVLGGWIEGVYVALNIAEESHNKNLIYKRIAEQKMSLDNLVELVKSYSEDPLILDYLNDLEKLQTIFDKVNITPKKMEIKTDTSKHLTKISGENTVEINENQIQEIKNTINNIRNKIVE